MNLTTPRFRMCFAVAVALWFGRADAAALTPAEVAAKVDPLFARWQKADAPGVIVGVSHHGNMVHARGYGMANLEHAAALSANTISESGSVAKQFTAAAVVLLAVRGQLSLDDSVRQHLPELSSLADPITIRMLLSHTSGLRDIHGIFDLMGRPSYTSMHANDEVVRVVARQRQLNFPPGTEYVYCNTGYVLAAQVVERVSRTSFNAFCVEQVFRPLGMLHTRWRDDFTAVVPGRAAGYAPRVAGGFRLDMPASNLVGNGGLLTTVGDLLTWTASFDGATGEWARVVELLQRPSTLSDGKPLTYALGLSIRDEPGFAEVAHGGATSGYRTYLARFPEHRLAVAILSNRADFNSQSAAHGVARALLKLPAKARVPKVEVSREDLAECAGLYHSERTDALLDFSVRSGALMYNSAALIPTGPRSFTTASGTTNFRFEVTGAEQRAVTVTSENATTAFAKKSRARPSAAALAAYAGTYYSEELEVSVTIEVKDGRLTLTRWPHNSINGTPTFAEGFWFARDWHATFRRDSGGKVTSAVFTNSSGRCRQIVFERR